MSFLTTDITYQTYHLLLYVTLYLCLISTEHRRLTVGPWGESIRGSVETKGGTSCWAVVWNLSMPHVNVLRCPKIWQARGTPIVSIAKALSSILETWHILKRSTSVICHGLKLQWSASGDSFQLFVRFSPWEPVGFGIVWHCNMNQWVKTVSAAIGWLAKEVEEPWTNIQRSTGRSSLEAFVVSWLWPWKNQTRTPLTSLFLRSMC